MAFEKVVAAFDNADHAENAVRSLVSAGIPKEDISVMHNDIVGDTTTTTKPGLWKRLLGADIEHHEASVYSDSVQKGGTVVSARVPDHRIDEATDILHGHNPVDVPERATSLGLSTTPVAPRVDSNLDKDEVIRLAEEQLEVGKRQVETGTTRVRRFVTQKEVAADVTLHEEHAEVMRRAVTDPGYITDIDWSDKTVEVRETAEEAVVSKTAHVAEELVVRKGGSDHVETIHETVRRQQAEVERIAAGEPRRA
jgi:uncharacterized protein (TIGR02271 family)